jgi:hypothetical protein
MPQGNLQNNTENIYFYLNVLSEGHLSHLTNSHQRPFARNVEFLLIFFRYSCIPANENFVYIDTTHTGTDSSRLKSDELSDEY